MHLTKTTEVYCYQKIVSGNHLSVSEHKPELSMKQPVTQTGFFCQQAEAVQVSGQADCLGRVLWRALGACLENG